MGSTTCVFEPLFFGLGLISSACFDYDGVIVDSIDALTDIAAAAQMELGLGRVPAVEDFRRIEELT